MIPVYDVHFTEEDAIAASNVVKSGILSSFGPEVQKLEKQFANYIGTKHALSCTSGTTALFLALAPFNTKKLTVAVPTCSYAATAFSVTHHQGDVVFIDSDLHTWNMDLDALELECKKRKIDVVLMVYNYGNPVNMDRLIIMSYKYDFVIVEDACEAFTSTFRGRRLGSFGSVGVFSFYGNKLISSGEGGMVVTNDDKIYEHMKLLRGQGQDPNRRFWHLVDGWNFRMTNLQAAIINSQFNRLNEIIRKKRTIYEYYRDHLDADLIWQTIPHGGESCWWMMSVRHWEPKWYDKASKFLEANGIETRPIFPPIHKMPAMQKYGQYDLMTFTNAESLWETGISLPSGPTLTTAQLEYICKTVNKAV